MAETNTCVSGDGGPLVVLQAAAVPHWQGARNFENSLMNGGDTETDYDFLCDSAGMGEVCVISRHEREMLALWDSEFGANFLTPQALLLSPDALVLTMCYHADDLANILPKMVEGVQNGHPERSLLFHVHDTTLRLQVGADSSEPSYDYRCQDMPISPGPKRCEIYSIEHDTLHDEIVIIKAHQDDER